MTTHSQDSLFCKWSHGHKWPVSPPSFCFTDHMHIYDWWQLRFSILWAITWLSMTNHSVNFPPNEQSQEYVWTVIAIIWCFMSDHMAAYYRSQRCILLLWVIIRLYMTDHSQEFSLYERSQINVWPVTISAFCSGLHSCIECYYSVTALPTQLCTHKRTINAEEPNHFLHDIWAVTAQTFGFMSDHKFMYD